MKWIDGKVQKTWKCHWNRSNVITHSSTCKKNLIKFYPFQWHFHFFGTLSVYPFHRHLLYPFLWHLVCPSISYWPKLFKKKFRIEIWTFSFQICFRNQFSTSGSGQTENTQIRVFAYFQFDHFPKSKIDSESIFEMRMSLFLF